MFHSQDGVVLVMGHDAIHAKIFSSFSLLQDPSVVFVQSGTPDGPLKKLLSFCHPPMQCAIPLIFLCDARFLLLQV